jgi:hypothetical protein
MVSPVKEPLKDANLGRVLRKSALCLYQLPETLLLFLGIRQSTGLRPSACHDVYGTIKERLTGHVSTICALGSTRVAEIYRAVGTALEIKLLTGTGERTRYFLIKYEG